MGQRRRAGRQREAVRVALVGGEPRRARRRAPGRRAPRRSASTSCQPTSGTTAGPTCAPAVWAISCAPRQMPRVGHVAVDQVAHERALVLQPRVASRPGRPASTRRRSSPRRSARRRRPAAGRPAANERTSSVVAVLGDDVAERAGRRVVLVDEREDSHRVSVPAARRRSRRPGRRAQPPRSRAGGRRRTGAAASPRRSACAYGSPRRMPSPPPITTASTSSRLTAEATPLPSASTRLVDDLARQLVVVFERARPDAARQPLAAALLHDLEEVGLAALALVCSLRARASIDAAPGVGLHAAAAPARAAAAVHLDDHVADLAGGAAAGPRLAVEHDAAADAGAPEHAEERRVLARRAELELRGGGHRHVVADRDRRADGVATAARPAGTGRSSRAGCAPGRRCPPRRRSPRATRRRRPSARRGRCPAAARGVGQRVGQLRGDRLGAAGGRASGGARRRAPCSRRRRRRPGSSCRPGRSRRAAAPLASHALTIPLAAGRGVAG